MTCLIGIKTDDGRALVAADSRVTWTGSTKTHTDDLQKLYLLTDNAFCAVSGHLLPAQKILIAARAALLRRKRRTGLALAGRLITAMLFSFWKSRSLRGQAHFIVCLCGSEGVQLSIWNAGRERPKGQRAFWRLREIPRGNVILLGSILKNAELSRELKSRLALIAHQPRLADETLAALLATKLADFFQGEAAASVDVGGLFQISSLSDEGLGVHPFQGHSYSTTGTVYSVALEWDRAANRWIQKNHVTGKKIGLLRLDEIDFSRSRRSDTLLTYGQGGLGGV